jgi:hypothetical protein
MQKIRCAIYTRKNSEDGLEQEFKRHPAGFLVSNREQH